MKQRLEAAQAAAKGFRLRSFVGKIVNLRDDGNVYGEKLPREKLDGLMDEIVDAEFLRHSVLEAARAAPVSCKEAASALGVDAAEVLKAIIVLRRKNLLELDRIDGTTPYYKPVGEGN